jgi:hypothetical protein
LGVSHKIAADVVVLIERTRAENVLDMLKREVVTVEILDKRMLCCHCVAYGSIV